jgi:hypothetical protein
MPTVNDLLGNDGRSGVAPRQLKELAARMEDESLSPNEREAARADYEAALAGLKKTFESLPKVDWDKVLEGLPKIDQRNTRFRSRIRRGP